MKMLLSSVCILLLACECSVFVNSANAQSQATRSIGSLQNPGQNLYTGGWKATNRTAQPGAAQYSRPPVDQSSVVQSAFYQPPGNAGLPPFPGGNANPPASNFASDNQATMSLPLPNGMPSSMPNAVSNVPSGSLSGMDTTNYPSNQGSYPTDNQPVTPSPQLSQFDAYARQQQQVLPPSTQANSSPFRTASTGDNLRAAPSNNDANNNAGNGLRPAPATMQRGFGLNTQQIPVASGYPFVSPAPRTGNYPTSPYNGSLFRSVAYQNVVQSPQAPLSAAVANTQPTLPQNAPVGVYPTQYQCTPGAAIYPPPGAVPGTYVPPTLTPNLTPGTYSPNNSGYTPFFSLGQENYNVQLGRGIIGQPTVYVPGQPIRNFMRYLSP